MVVYPTHLLIIFEIFGFLIYFYGLGAGEREGKCGVSAGDLNFCEARVEQQPHQKLKSSRCVFKASELLI